MSLRRPQPNECLVVMFSQPWPASMLPSATTHRPVPDLTYSVLVHWIVTGYVAVYFGETGRLAYLIPPKLKEAELQGFIGQQRMPDVDEAALLGWTSPH